MHVELGPWRRINGGAVPILERYREHVLAEAWFEAEDDLADLAEVNWRLSADLEQIQRVAYNFWLETSLPGLPDLESDEDYYATLVAPDDDDGAAPFGDSWSVLDSVSVRTLAVQVVSGEMDGRSSCPDYAPVA
jgi:hypothetical protein